MRTGIFHKRHFVTFKIKLQIISEPLHQQKAVA